MLVTEERQREILEGLDLGIPEDRLFDVESEAWKAAVARHRGLPAPDVEIDPAVPYLLLFTSGTTGAPKAAVCSQARLAVIGAILVGMQNFTKDDVVYAAMPMFRSDAVMAGWVPALTAGATLALRRRFSASGFLPDVRRFGVTYFNYVGKPLAYILATPERPDDADNTLTRVFGNEASDRDIERFSERFGCAVFDAYGSTEGAISISKVSGSPSGSLGVGAPGTVVLDPETGRECPRARFGDEGFLAEQSDLGTKWAPRYVRIASELPATSTNKIVKRELRRERWECADPVWLRDDGGYRRLDPSGVEDIRNEFVARNRESVLDTWT
jgi:fatty-acyl-CoA synthase